MMKTRFLIIIGIIIIVISIIFLIFSIFEYTKQYQAFIDYFTKPSNAPSGSGGPPVPDTNTFIPYLIIGIITGACGIFTIIQSKKRLKMKLWFSRH